MLCKNLMHLLKNVTCRIFEIFDASCTVESRINEA